jgi:ABC-type Fe3+-siderophore transport system permease subunit
MKREKIIQIIIYVIFIVAQIYQAIDIYRNWKLGLFPGARWSDPIFIPGCIFGIIFFIYMIVKEIREE